MGWKAAMLNGLDNNDNHPLAMLLDDAAADLRIFDGTIYSSDRTGWETAPSEKTWGGAFQYLKAGWVNTIRVVWGPRGLLPAGKYQLWVRVPDTLASASPVEYFLLIDGIAVDRTTPRTLNQADAAGTWLAVGEYEITKASSVQVVMEAAKDITGDIGIDAVALITIPE